MAKSKLIKGRSAVNQHMNISFASSEQLSECLDSGYQYLMVKIPGISEMPHLKPLERRCLRLLIKGNVTKAIAYDMDVSEDYVRKLLSSLRDKFQCSVNTELVSKVYFTGFHLFI